MEVSSIRQVAVLGIGNHFKTYKKVLDGHIDFLAYLDNDNEKWGKNLFGDGVPCISPEHIRDYDADTVVIGVAKGSVQGQLISQVEAMNLPYCFLDELVDLYIDEYEASERERRKRTVDDFFSGREGNHRIFLLNTPEITSTVGDHAISTAEMLFLRERFKDRTIIEIGDRFFWEYREEIAWQIYPTDVLLIQGGGYMGSLWRMWREDTIRYILQRYPDNHIVILPHTMYFEDTEDGRTQYAISREIYNSHRYLTVCFREKVSYERSADMFKEHVKRYLIPDSVLSMKYTGKRKIRNGVAIFFKNDKETLVSKEKQAEIRSYFENNGIELIETSMFLPEQVSDAKEREQLIRDKMEEIAGFRLFITDAMHGMVLAAVCGTPCIGVETITGKVGAMYEWIKELPYVEHDGTGDGVIKKVELLMGIEKRYEYSCSELDTYFDRLGEIIWDQFSCR